MDRRKFLTSGLGAIGGLLLPWKRKYTSAQTVPPAKTSKVWMFQGEPQEAANRLVEAVGGLKSLLPQNGVVLIKPNIAFPAPPERGVTTDPQFLAALIDLCIEAGARRVVIIDHPVGASPEKNLERSGIGAVCQARHEVQALLADKQKFFQVREIPKGRSLKHAETANILDKADLFINIPTAKHHSATGVSLGLKNLMGLIWDRVPLHEAMDLDQAIADLATVICPQLTFLDAHYSLLTNGPTGPGQVEETNTYLAGFDPLAVDSIGVTLARWEGRVQKGDDIVHLVKARELGVGELDREKIELISL